MSSLPTDLLKSSTPITTAKISNKLRELAFKLDVERKLKAGSERLAVLYKNDPSMGDKKNRAGVTGELLESNEKIVLLKRALQKYQQLFVPGMEDDGKLSWAHWRLHSASNSRSASISFFRIAQQLMTLTVFFFPSHLFR